jgi:hypothetical protein
MARRRSDAFERTVRTTSARGDGHGVATQVATPPVLPQVVMCYEGDEFCTGLLARGNLRLNARRRKAGRAESDTRLSLAGALTYLV